MTVLLQSTQQTKRTAYVSHHVFECSSICHIVYPVFPMRGCALSSGTFFSTESGVNQTRIRNMHAPNQTLLREIRSVVRGLPPTSCWMWLFFTCVHWEQCLAWGVLHRGKDKSGQGRGDNSVLCKEGLHCCAFFICFVLTYGDGHSKRWTCVLLFSFDGF